MKYKPYQKYKDSGVEWMGEIPDGWVIGRVMDSSVLRNGYPFDSAKFNNDEGYPIVRIRDIYGDTTPIRYNGDWVEDVVIRNGDVLIGLDGDFGIAFWNSSEALLNQRVCMLRASDQWLIKYIYYCLYKPIQIINDLTYSTTVKHLSSEQVNKIRIPIPSHSTIKTIAAFLDAETARIDGLVKDYEELIELLKEKRQTLISHAVTRGLSELVSPDDPEFGEWAKQVKFKDSGVEWIGEIPEGWEVKKLKFVLDNIKAGPFGSALTKDMYTSSGIRVFGQEQVIPGDFSIGDYYISDSQFNDLQQYEACKGDILISCVGTFGKIAIVPEDAERGIINPRLIRLRANLIMNPQFLTTFLKSVITFSQFDFFSRGGTMDVINVGTLSELYISFPDYQEQEAIASFLDRETSKLDALVSEAESAIELLKEYRSALITNAVTGKINVEASA